MQHTPKGGTILAIILGFAVPAAPHGGPPVTACSIVGIGGDLAYLRGIRFTVDRSFTAIDLGMDAAQAGSYIFTAELRRSSGFLGAPEATTSGAVVAPGRPQTVPYPSVHLDWPRIAVSGPTTFTLKFIAIAGPSNLFFEVAGIGSFPCPGFEVSNENDTDTPTLRSTPTSFRVLGPPLFCAAGGPYQAQCPGARTCLALDGTGSSGENPLAFSWSSGCAGADFGGSEHSPRPTLCLDSSGCSTACAVELVVNDGPQQATCLAAVTVVDTEPPDLVAALRPLAPRSAASASSACSAMVRVECLASDVCDPAPLLQAHLLVTRHEVAAPCRLVSEEVPVDCGEELDLRLLPSPCLPRKPKPTPPTVSAPPVGRRVVHGEGMLLVVSATDRCGNQGQATFDPAAEPVTLPILRCP